MGPRLRSRIMTRRKSRTLFFLSDFTFSPVVTRRLWIGSDESFSRLEDDGLMRPYAQPPPKSAGKCRRRSRFRTFARTALPSDRYSRHDGRHDVYRHAHQVRHARTRVPRSSRAPRARRAGTKNLNPEKESPSAFREVASPRTRRVALRDAFRSDETMGTFSTCSRYADSPLSTLAERVRVPQSPAHRA